MKDSYLFLLIFTLVLASCSERKARRPVSHTTYTLAETSEQMKKINQLEEAKIQAYIKNDSLINYIASPNGFWFHYANKIESDTATPKKEDVVELSYDILDLNGEIIYSKEELGIKEYKVDKEDFIPALQQGIKMMKVGETVKFVIPSYNAFGVVGDNNRIGINESIISNVTLINIKQKE